jgi:hypothetical protein
VDAGTTAPRPQPSSTSWDPSRFGGTWESPDADTGFLGTWEATDVDASSLLLGVRVSEASDTFEVLLLDDLAEKVFDSRQRRIHLTPLCS